ncbi:hypothetical protein ACGFLT_28930 [Micromonospora chalcea]
MTHLTLKARRQRVALLGGSLVLVLLTGCHADPRPAGTASAAPRRAAPAHQLQPPPSPGSPPSSA